MHDFFCVPGALPSGELGPEVLEDAVVCLRRGIRSCRERMVYLRMVAGEYQPVLNAINLREFGLGLSSCIYEPHRS